MAMGLVVLGGCGGNAAPSGGASPTPGPVASSAPSSPAPAVTLRAPHSLVYAATGTAAVTSVVYELDGHATTKRSVKLPWRMVVEVPSDGKRHTWKAAVNIRDGRVELLAIFDGGVVGQSRGQVSGGTGTVSAGGDLRG